ncbi:MAG: hypothetical protein ACXWD3_02465, partial [Mycobacterium sp.]
MTRRHRRRFGLAQPGEILTNDATRDVRYSIESAVKQMQSGPLIGGPRRTSQRRAGQRGGGRPVGAFVDRRHRLHVGHTSDDTARAAVDALAGRLGLVDRRPPVNTCALGYALGYGTEK